MKIKDIMTREVEIVTPDTKLVEAARRMREADTGFLPVGEEDRLVGTVTDRDITVRCVAEGADPHTATVRDAMTDELVYAFDDQDAMEAAQIMSDHAVRRLPVLNRDKRLVGVVSLGDIAAEAEDDDVVGQAEEGISQAPPNN